MINTVLNRHQKTIAWFFLIIFYFSNAVSGLAAFRINYKYIGNYSASSKSTINNKNVNRPILKVDRYISNVKVLPSTIDNLVEERLDDIGGPSQPEMSSFKPVDANNMVNLFTGNFSYNIPLLDVGGYPVNIFYDGGITPDQEASWVGLGWNINPGTINRNMRGVPDEFDGTDIMTQTQDMKPNKTWGVRLGVDVEVVGIKPGLPAPSDKRLGVSLGESIGVSFNNHLGPALEYGLKGGLQFSVIKKVGSEKNNFFKVGGNAGVNLSSRDGATFSMGANVGFVKKLKSAGESLSMGLGVSTSYNSRSGIKSLQISDQLSFSNNSVHYGLDKNDNCKLVTGRNNQNLSANLWATSISFSKPSYMPAMRMPITHTAGSGHIQVGGAWWLMEGDAELEIYAQKSEIKSEDKVQQKPMFGYFNYEKANGNKDAMLDFVRLGDKEVTPNTPIISAPNYTYDVFAISGEGTGGTIRAYRNDLGTVHDNYTRTKDVNWSGGAEISPPSQYGANFSYIKTPSTISEWQEGNLLRTAIPFTAANGTYENVYFKNPGEASIVNPNEYDNIGGTDLVRWKLGGDGFNPTVLPVLQRMNKNDGSPTTLNDINVVGSNADRKKRTQVINFLSAKDASIIGLDKVIKNYSRMDILDASNNLLYQPIDRVSGDRKPHHISQINVTEADGKRYVYGIPVYNHMQQDFSFTVDANLDDPNDFNRDNNQAKYDPNRKTNVDNTSKQDGYIQSTVTPAYAHSFLLSGLLSPDYVDVTGDGITEDDLGNAVKFNYSKMDGYFKWRAPHTKVANWANFNDGNRTEGKDNKGMVSYGEREEWYMHSIESKTMIAVFTLSDREDKKSVTNEDGGINNSGNNVSKKLDKIDLYSKADLKANGISGAKPIKTVHFEYNYNLCPGTPDNSEIAVDVNGALTSDASKNVNAKKGKLTLAKIYFTFNGQNRANKNQYVFGYGEDNTTDNPSYAYNSSDRWGNYKPKAENPGSLNNADFPYTIQDKNKTGAFASAWNLKSILLPSGGQIDVEYEADDYAYVQDKKAMVMMQIAGFGNSPSSMNDHLYEVNALSITENDYVFIDIPESCSLKPEINSKYLNLSPSKDNQLAFKLMVEMPKGFEYIPVYAVVEDYGFAVENGVENHNRIWVKLREVDHLSPLSLATIDYLRTSLPGQAYPGYDVSEQTTLGQIGSMLIGLLDGLAASFNDPVNYLRVMRKNSAQKVHLPQSFVRLCSSTGIKYGGGSRVKTITLRDNWDVMTQQAVAKYAQKYDYTTTDPETGKIISSGVASYEPSIGGDENPLQEMLQVANTIPLGPTSYGSIEMPVLDALFQAPCVGYSKVTVTSNRKASTSGGIMSHSGIGKQVTEYYTAKDFPVRCSYTNFDGGSNMQVSHNSTTAFFWKYAFDARTQSQGFLVENNDMHGKMKSQASYAENDEKTAINSTTYYYKNTGENEMNDRFQFVSNSTGGNINEGNMGIDIELMTDTREFKVSSLSTEIQAQVDQIWIPLPIAPFLAQIWIPFVWPVDGESENTYRAVTTTKTVNYHAVVDKVLVKDKGSQVTTENMVYDAETGQLVVNKTQNEFNDYIYNTTYPAYWAYSGMGLAYKNIDAVYSGVNFYNGRIVNGNPSNINYVFESGDELYLINSGTEPANTCNNDPRLSSPSAVKLWAYDINKNNSSLTNSQLVNNDLLFITEKGIPYSKDGVSFRIIRSGKRNILGATVQSITSMENPIVNNKLNFSNNGKVITASAVEYKEKWQVDPGIIKYTYQIATGPCETEERFSCSPSAYSTLETHINPYTKGLLGTFRTWQNKVLYSSRLENNLTSPAQTNIAQNGFVSNFLPYWNFNGQNSLINDINNINWVYNSKITKINSVGQELETKNALDVYTSALYGYHKNLPLAIANNSRSNEMIFDGFEDDGFDAKLSSSNLANTSSSNTYECANKRWISASKSNKILEARNLGFNAHTGKQVFSVKSQNKVVCNIINSNTENQDNYNIISENLALFPNFNDKGMNVDLSNFTYCPTSNSSYPASGVLTQDPNSYEFTIQPPQFNQNNSCPLPFGLSFPVTSSSSFSNVIASGYIVINTLGYYTVNVTGRAGGYNSNCTGQSNIFDFVVENDFGKIMNSDPNHNDQYCLKPGIYKISFRASGISLNPASCNANQTCPCVPTNWAYQHTFTPSIAVYKTLDNTNTNCSIPISLLKPIKASEAMVNPQFAPSISSPKMLFSAWVRENSIGVGAEGKPAYTNSSVDIDFGTGTTSVTLVPKGNIIDGWQRIEGEFIIPLGAISMNLILNNSDVNSPNYWDDIRIHPYNANMKSYVYDPINLRLVAELDENNYAKFYEYDDEGILIRTKAETKEGIKTITETRSAKQKVINSIQP